MAQHCCPICQQAMPGSSATQGAEWPNYPFCSRKCRLVDLGRWLNGTYAEKIHDESAHAPEDPSSTDEY